MVCPDYQTLVRIIEEFAGQPASNHSQYEQVVNCLNLMFNFANRAPFPSDQILWVLILFVHFAILVAFLISFSALYSSF